MSGPYKEIVFDSATSVNNNADNPTWFLADNRNVVGSTIVSATIPFSFYVIDRSCNTFTMMTHTAEGDSECIIYINPGTYSPTGFQNELRRALAQHVADGTTAGTTVDPPLEDHLGYFFWMNTETLRLNVYNISEDVETGDTFSIKVDNENLAKMMGFTAGVTYTSTREVLYVNGEPLNSGNAVLVVKAPEILNLLQEKCLNLHGELHGLDTTTEKPVKKDNLLMSCPIQGSFGNYFTHINTGLTQTVHKTPITVFEAYFQLGERTEYYANSRSQTNTDTVSQNYVPFNKMPFQITVRFYYDTT